MVRKQVYITSEQEQELKLSAERLGVTEAELIRRGIELVRRERELDDAARRESERRAAAEALIGLLKKRAEEHPEGGGIGKFDRDEVYAERLDRFGRILP